MTQSTEAKEDNRKLKALIIDDKKIIGDMFNFILGFHGHNITFISNPNNAMDTVKNERFDIAFCDIVMPQKNGIDLLEEIKESVPDLPVVMMSGFTVEDQRERAVELGAVAMLDKPFRREEVLEVIKLATGIEI